MKFVHAVVTFGLGIRSRLSTGWKECSLPESVISNKFIIMTEYVERIIREIDGSKFENIENWHKLLDVLHILTTIENSKTFKIKSEGVLAQVLDKFLVHGSLVQLWKLILASRQDVSKLESASLLNGFRLVCNYFKEETPPAFLQNNYHERMMQSLYECVEDATENELQNLVAISSEFSSGLLQHFISALTVGNWTECTNSSRSKNNCEKVLRHMNPHWVLEATKILLKCTNWCDEKVCESGAVKVKTFVDIALGNGATVGDAVDALILGKLSSIIATKSPTHTSINRTIALTAQVIVEALPQEGMSWLIDSVGLVWGDKFFISKVDAMKQSFLTHVLLSALAHCEKKDLAILGSRHIPLELVLSIGISNYLDVDNAAIRVHGMRVAKAYALVMGQELSFPELEKLEEANMSFRSSAKPKANQPTQAAVSPATSAGARFHMGTDAGTGSGIDSDSSDEIQGYRIDEEDEKMVGGSGIDAASSYNYKDKLLRSNYLRDCLQSKF